MELLVSPLSWPGMTPHMLNIIRKALLNLLTLADEYMNITDLDYEDIPLEQGCNYGTSLVVAHIQPIIQFLADAVDSSVKKFNQINLELLSKLSAYTPNGTLARKMASTIIGHLERKLPKEPTLKKLLDVVGSLMKNVVGSDEFLRRVGPLFSKVEGRACREPLVRIVEGLAANPEVSEDVGNLLRIVSDLESWDRSRVDEPDQDRRHAAYARLNDIKDISLRTSSAANLRYLIEYFGRSGHEEKEKSTILTSDLIHVVTLGLRSQTEIVREESIRCLTSLVDKFTEHNHLKQLAQLRNPEEDLDFFSNIIHIQHHRRQRAVHRLVEQLSTGKVTIAFDVLNKYLIPIAHPYLISTDSKLSGRECRFFSILPEWLKIP
ncbi:hypothetical protein ANCCAN_22269 [Ancylostoma caninum]|uniref:U3 small nucleolar RNA-associated protein 20 N-terminal domain-containing protein n=1 Tax=Ancylostoma caninum TaxID=29170 RepID=A0A368FIH1_ANCCA|nr:hypothetical protein ANCCAN_22269 [Ancylostoma caninum]